MSKLGNIHQIIDHAGHYRSGFVFVKVGKRQLLQFLKHIPPHIRLHSDTDDMTVVLNKIIQPCLEQINANESHSPDKK